MKRIDRTNYEAWLLDRLEDRLTAAEERALDAFLLANPDLLPGAGTLPVFEATAVTYSEKDELKRALPPRGMPDVQQLDDFLVARMEGELSAEQLAALDELLRNDSSAARTWSIMQRTRVMASPVEFPDKAGLRRREARVIVLWQRYAIAASIALLLGLAWWTLRQRGGEGPQFSDKENATGPGLEKAPKVPELEQEAPAPVAEVKEQGSPVPSVVHDDQDDVEDGIPTPRAIERERVPDRIDPMLVQWPEGERAPVGVTIPDVPVSADPPVEFAEAAEHGTTNDALTMGELLAATVRNEVLDQPDAPVHALDGNDAVALLDKGLGAVSGDQAGLTYQRNDQRRRFKLRLGDNLAFAASTSR